MNSTSGKSGRKRKATTKRSDTATRLFQRLVKSLQKWSCDPASYPAVAKMNSQVKQVFVSHHAMLHLMKRVGTFATILEKLGHGQVLDPTDKIIAERTFGKLLLDAVRVAVLLGMTPESMSIRLRLAEAELH